MGLASSFPERKVSSFSAEKIEQVKILRRIKYRTPDEETRLAQLEDEKVDFLSWKALQENGFLNGPAFGQSDIRCLDILSVEDETRFLNICLKYETSGIISLEEHRFLDYTSHLAVLRFCNLAKVNYWEYVNDFDDTSIYDDDDEDIVDDHCWWEQPARNIRCQGDLKRRHRTF